MNEVILDNVRFKDEFFQLKHEFEVKLPKWKRMLVQIWVTALGGIMLGTLLVFTTALEGKIITSLSFVVGILLGVFLQVFLPQKQINLILTDKRVIKKTTRTCLLFRTSHFMEVPLVNIRASKLESWKGINPIKLFVYLFFAVVLSLLLFLIVFEKADAHRTLYLYLIGTVAVLFLIISFLLSYEQIARLSLFSAASLRPASDIGFVHPTISSLLSPLISGVMNVVINDIKAFQVLSMFSHHISASASIELSQETMIDSKSEQMKEEEEITDEKQPLKEGEINSQ